jgi:predicted AlkP superfamily phosphohydrolase/phosphomutase
VVRDLVGALRELKDPETGGPLIGEIHPADDLYHGPFTGRAPDVTFLPADMRNKALGTVDFTSNRFVERAYGNSGDHRMNGILLMRGEGIRAGVRLEGAGLIDVAPTILHHLGEPVPSDVDGKVLMGAFTNEEAARPVRIAEAAAGADASEIGAGLTADEQEEIRRRLKGIGYLG